jgi:serine/threonine-protein kinase RsbW
MTQPRPYHLHKRLSLTSSLSELERVSPWISELAECCEIPGETRFAIELCLEEVLSNIVRHGYRAEPGHEITLDFTREDDSLFFVVEDSAPPFEPIQPGESGPMSLDTITPGGQGIRLLYRFASSVKYDRLPNGNRLTIRFDTPQSALNEE